jgi:1-pyrroline-5-carboxylate dehydrogenase
VCFEAGWTWRDADAEVADALDLLEFHAAAAEAAAAAGRLPEPRGAGVVLAPRQAPLAGAVAAASAALAAGHAVVLKASSVVPTLAWKAVEALLDAGVPGPALNLVTSDDPAFAAALARDERARFVCCGGGAERHAATDDPDAADAAYGSGDRPILVEPPVPGVVVVAAGADLDEASRVVVRAAFATAGQRRDACRRVIAHAGVFDALVEKLAAAADALLVGPAIDFTTDVGPLIDEPTARAVLAAVDEAARDGRVVVGGRGVAEAGAGHFVAPTVVADVADGAPLTRAGTGGPVVAVTRARDLDEALAFASATGDPRAVAVFPAEGEAGAVARLPAAGLHPRPRVGDDAARSFWARAFHLL